MIGCAIAQALAFDGALDIPLRRVMSLSPWLMRFTVAACRQEANTRYLPMTQYNTAPSSNVPKCGSCNLAKARLT